MRAGEERGNDNWDYDSWKGYKATSQPPIKAKGNYYWGTDGGKKTVSQKNASWAGWDTWGHGVGASGDGASGDGAGKGAGDSAAASGDGAPPGTQPNSSDVPLLKCRTLCKIEAVPTNKMNNMEYYDEGNYEKLRFQFVDSNYEVEDGGGPFWNCVDDDVNTVVENGPGMPPQWGK